MFRFAVKLCIALAMLVSAYSVEAAVYTVTKTADTSDGQCDADCSLREAITAANANVDNDTIVFALPFFSSARTITLGGTEMTVANNGSLTILGPGANRLTISGNNASRILVTGANVVVNIYNLRFTAGNGAGAVNTGRGGAIYNVGGTMLLANSILTGNSAANGGALNNAAAASPSIPANLTIDNCIFANNSATSSGSAMQNFSTSTLHIRNSTVNNNSTTATGIAGAFQANGTVTITNTTFSGNSAATGTGGGVYFNGTSLVMTNATIVGNSSGLGGGGLHRTGTTNPASIRNTIIADNAGAAATLDASGLVNSEGNNIIESVGTSTGWVAADQQNVDPVLAPLGFYGGFGMTHLPLAASTAINMGNSCVVNLSCPTANPPVAVAADERGVDRPFGANVDVGAVEASGDYYAVLPSAVAGVAYNYTLVPANGTFTYSLNSGGFGGILLSSTTSTTLAGTAPVRGVFNGQVLVMGASGQASQNYRINVFQDANSYSVVGRVLTNGGDPISKAYVHFDGLNGGKYTTISSPFGYFRLDDVAGGWTGTVTVSSKKGATFAPQTVTIMEATDDLELRAQP